MNGLIGEAFRSLHEKKINKQKKVNIFCKSEGYYIRDGIYYYDIPENQDRKRICVKISNETIYTLGGATHVYISFGERPHSEFDPARKKPLDDAFFCLAFYGSGTKNVVLFEDEEKKGNECYKGSIHVIIDHHANGVIGEMWVSHYEKEVRYV